MGWQDSVRSFFGGDRPQTRVVDLGALWNRAGQELEQELTPEQFEAGAREMEQPDLSHVLPRPQTEDDSSYFVWSVANFSDGLANWGDARRDSQLRDLWKSDSILAGAMSSMTQKMISLGWTVSGSRNRARRLSRVLFTANDGRGYSDFISKFTQDFLSCDRGAFIELGQDDLDNVAGIWNIDALDMVPRRNPDFPFWYLGGTESPTKVAWRDAVNVMSMPSPSDHGVQSGFCAISRAARAARLLIALYKYDADKLSNMPPQGLALISGMTERQVLDALKKYKMSLEQREQQLYPGVLWLASMTGNLDAKLVPFATLPDSFSRQEVIQIYVYTLALDFGVDAREFWPAAIAGATRADALVQAMKAKGKGPGELISVTERAINSRIAPEGTVFRFDFQDDEEDSLKAELDLNRAKVITELYTEPLRAGGQPLVSLEEGREMLARYGIIPRDMLEPAGELLISDVGGFRAEEDAEVVIEYREGILDETDMTKRFIILGNGHKNGHSTIIEPLVPVTEPINATNPN